MLKLPQAIAEFILRVQEELDLSDDFLVVPKTFREGRGRSHLLRGQVNMAALALHHPASAVEPKKIRLRQSSGTLHATIQRRPHRRWQRARIQSLEPWHVGGRISGSGSDARAVRQPAENVRAPVSAPTRRRASSFFLEVRVEGIECE
ncbi:hypothetical protein MTO96_005254 [Rhipicephalus appendiculatus]